MQQIDIDRYNKGQRKYKVIDAHMCFDVFWIYFSDTGKTSFHDFLINPEWRWRKMFDKDPDYQREFDEWLVKNKLGGKCMDGGFWLYDKNEGEIDATPKMLTGVILSFMQERMK